MLETDELDFLIGFNSIDHGWDVKKSIDECIRVSKCGVLSFDTNRYKLPTYPDRSHYQIVDYDEMVDYVSSKPEVKSNWFETANVPLFSNEDGQIQHGEIKIFEFYWEK